ncbi:MAG: hypothetical protein HUK26_08250, partial [Duodenibacillus sp.]|nr:hypothetical protein [Duodenibacillus sp.]
DLDGGAGVRVRGSAAQIQAYLASLGFDPKGNEGTYAVNVTLKEIRLPVNPGDPEVVLSTDAVTVKQDVLNIVEDVDADGWRTQIVDGETKAFQLTDVDVKSPQTLQPDMALRMTLTLPAGLVAYKDGELVTSVTGTAAQLEAWLESLDFKPLDPGADGTGNFNVGIKVEVVDKDGQPIADPCTETVNQLVFPDPVADELDEVPPLSDARLSLADNGIALGDIAVNDLAGKPANVTIVATVTMPDGLKIKDGDVYVSSKTFSGTAAEVRDQIEALAIETATEGDHGDYDVTVVVKQVADYGQEGAKELVSDTLTVTHHVADHMLTGHETGSNFNDASYSIGDIDFIDPSYRQDETIQLKVTVTPPKDIDIYVNGIKSSARSIVLTGTAASIDEALNAYTFQTADGKYGVYDIAVEVSALDQDGKPIEGMTESKTAEQVVYNHLLKENLKPWEIRASNEDAVFGFTKLDLFSADGWDDEITVRFDVPAQINVPGLITDGTGRYVTFTGTQADAQAWFNGLRFTPEANVNRYFMFNLTVTQDVTAPDGTELTLSEKTDVWYFIYPMNDAPQADTDKPVTPAEIREDAKEPVTLTTENFGVLKDGKYYELTDPDFVTGDQVAKQIAFHINTLPERGELLFNGRIVSAADEVPEGSDEKFRGTVFTLEDILDGKVTYRVDGEDVREGEYVNFTCSVDDGAGGKLSG